jgi:hypothetical protein
MPSALAGQLVGLLKFPKTKLAGAIAIAAVPAAVRPIKALRESFESEFDLVFFILLFLLILDACYWFLDTGYWILDIYVVYLIILPFTVYRLLFTVFYLLPTFPKLDIEY